MGRRSYYVLLTFRGVSLAKENMLTGDIYYGWNNDNDMSCPNDDGLENTEL